MSAAPRFGTELKREWRALLASMLSFSCAIATLGLPYSLGTMIGPLQQEFGWSLAEILLVQPIVTAAVVLMSAAVGWWVDSHPVRPVVLWSQWGMGLGFIALGLLTQSLQSFYAIYFITAVLGGGTLAVTFMKLLTPRFERERGIALGIALAGSGLSSFILQPLLVNVVDRFGWRAGYVSIGLLTLLVIWPIAWFWLDSRRSVTPQAATVATSAPLLGVTLGAALRDYRFWILFAIFFLFSGAITGVLTNSVPILTEQGYPRMQAATIAGVFGISVIVGRICIGALIDRAWAPMIGCVFFLAAALGIVLLSRPGFTLPAHVLFLALAGLAAGAEVDLMAYLVSRYFGLREFGKIYGGIYISFALGPGPLVPLFGFLRDSTGNYSLGLLWVGVSLGVAGLLLLTLGRYPIAFGVRH